MNYVMLKDVCAINMGQSPDSNSYNNTGDGIPFFQGNADFGVRYPVTRKWCSAPTKLAAPGDILISVRAPIGAMNYAKEDCCIGRGLAALTPDKSKVSPEFIFWLLKSKNIELNSKGTGSTFKAIGRKVLEETMIPEISLEKQLEVSEILERVYEIIQIRKEELQKLDQLINARFVELFGGKKYEIVKAGSIIKEMRNGVSPSTSGGHFEKVLTLSAITQGKFDDEAWKEGFFTDCPSAEKRITEDDFYICRGNGNKSLVGMGVYALENRPDLVFPDTVIAAHIDTERMVLPYLWIMWQQPEVRKQLESGARTTNGTYKINQKVISEIKIICPPINEQEVFADFVKQVNKSKVAIQKALDKTQMLFDSLMQEYFG